MLEERIEVIGIDHGWSNMKKVNKLKLEKQISIMYLYQE